MRERGRQDVFGLLFTNVQRGMSQEQVRAAVLAAVQTRLNTLRAELGMAQPEAAAEVRGAGTLQQSTA